MKNIKLSLFEIYALEAEINGIVNPSTQERVSSGLISQNLSLKTKYWLTKLSDSLASEKKSIDGIRDGLVKELGVEENGSYLLNMTIKDEKNPDRPIPNPNWIKFNNEFEKFLQEEKEISYNEFKIEDLENISTNENYPIFYKLISIKEELEG